ncbi:MAG: GMC family oxidoreductase [Anaerolineae bacterium]|nr:GMC family oxidoreductase [Anaerolineae bacterium]
MVSRRTVLIGFLTGAGAAATAGIFGWRYIARLWNSLTARQPQVKPLAEAEDSYDVIIIGSGPAGSVLGKDLVEQGKRTLILEGGPLLSNPDPKVQPIRLDTATRTSGDFTYPLIGTRVRAVGGTSNIWTGNSPRLYPLDFERNAYTPSDAEWPITYEEIESYYERAEQTLRVRGKPLSNYHAPRRDPNLPIPVPFWNIDGLTELLEPAGFHFEISPRSEGLADDNAPLHTVTDILPFFTDSPNATLISGAVVLRLNVDEEGNIASVDVSDYDGNIKTIQAKAYVVASGGVESARMLLQSQSDVYPNGIGNDNDLVGRFFMEHPNFEITGVLPSAKRIFSYQLRRAHNFYQDYKERGLGSVIFYSQTDESGVIRLGASLEMEPQAENRVTLLDEVQDGFGNPGINLNLTFSDRDRETITAMLDQAEAALRQIGATEIQRTDQLYGWSHHHMGTCRMGDDPATSVVDANLRVHSTNNCYVLSSAVFVTSGGSHPTLMIAALAHRLAEHLSTLV